MRVKKYHAHSMPKAMDLIRADLGPDAVILHSQKVHPGGMLGRLRPPILEVIAAVDTDLRDFPQPTPATTEAIAQIQHEVSGLKLALNHITQAQREPDLPINLDDSYRRLLEQGVANHLARQIITTIANELSSWTLNNPSILNQHLRWQLAHKLSSPVSSVASDQSNVACVVGTTGVGKTTTIAKLAASRSCYAFAQEQLLIITIDTFRLAALPQITTFGEILGVPVEVAYTPEQLVALIKGNNQRRFVLVDTPGCSQRNTIALTEIGQFLSVIPTKTVHLAMAAGAKYEDMYQTIEAFGPMGINSLIFTKLDETLSLGPAYTLACETGLPISYLSTGQHVPEDLEVATAERMVDLVIGPSTTQPYPNRLPTNSSLFSQNEVEKIV